MNIFDRAADIVYGRLATPYPELPTDTAADRFIHELYRYDRSLREAGDRPLRVDSGRLYDAGMNLLRELDPEFTTDDPAGCCDPMIFAVQRWSDR